MISRRSVLRHCLAACLIVSLLAPAMALCAKVVTYTFAGEVSGVDPLVEDFPIAAGDAVTGSIRFHSGARLLPPRGEEDNFWAYYPSGIFHLTIGQHTWSNAQPGGEACGVWMHIGWPQASFWCPLENDDGLTRMRLDFWIASGGPTTMSEPYPMGPFDPADFRKLRIGGDLNLLGPDGRVQVADLKLTDVQFTPEPGVMALMLIIALALPYFRR